MTKILLDTDIGTDVDDAVALAYLLAKPECELVGITTVSGEADKRAALASVLCILAGKDIPIFPGAENPIQGAQRQTTAQQAAALPRWPHRAHFPRGEAIEFMHQIIHDHPGEVHLLAVGPLTNLGLLFSSDPEVPRLLDGLTLMGGIFSLDFKYNNGIEWNARCDPTATAIVYNAPVRMHRSIGMDVTQQVVMPAGEVRARFKGPLLEPVLDFAEIWFEQFFPSITFHDPLAAATIFDDTLCAYDYGKVSVDVDSQPGKTRWKSGASGSPHQIAVQVDPQRYFDHFFEVIEHGLLHRH